MGRSKEHLRKEQNDKENIKPRPEKNKNRNKDTQTVPVSQPVKEEGEHQTGQKAEGNAGNRNRKKPYYRNRRRNRPDGAKEQHEA